VERELIEGTLKETLHQGKVGKTNQKKDNLSTLLAKTTMEIS